MASHVLCLGRSRRILSAVTERLREIVLLQSCKHSVFALLMLLDLVEFEPLQHSDHFLKSQLNYFSYLEVLLLDVCVSVWWLVTLRDWSLTWVKWQFLLPQCHLQEEENLLHRGPLSAHLHLKLLQLLFFRELLLQNGSL